MAIYRGPGGPGDATTDATNEATVATNKAAEAASSAASAATSASTASTKATQASNSATSAATSASNASTSATAAASSATSAQSAETGATNSATNAASSAYDASTYATTATTQASAASTSATNAATSATTASTQATNAANSATAAATSATNAASSATAAAASYDSFDDRYLGAKASAPTTDNDGDALLTGAIYWNTTDDSLYIWDGAAWNAAAFTATGAVTSFNTRTGAVTLSSGDVTTALGFTPSTVANLDDITDVTITSPSTNQVLKYNGSAWVNDSDTDTGILYTDLSVSTGAAGSPALSYNNTNGVFTYTPPDLSSFITASSTDTLTNKSGNISQWTNDSGYLTSETYTGTVTSVAATVPTGFTVTGSPITASGTLAVAFDTGYALPTSASQTNWDTAYGWGDHSTQGYALDSNIGVTIQAYDADTAKVDVAQTFTVSQRGTVTSDNDLSFDQNATNNFSCTPTAGGTLTFTNHTSGQSGYVLLDNSGGYAITAAATTKIHADDLTTISTAGVYLLSYFDNGTNAYITVSKTFS